ncbi:hypothetical protein [uncultured Sulfitobacter sp.]|uniref:hypothetical protein n=1 Tax=Sulfitobacter sp. SH22 TaxID=3421172 RepID=UPI0025F0E15A|nr:hypothetical protein [uncultured Sulfitobacter sp.]
MKPNFALSLSIDGISLLHRTAGGWRSIGDVSIDAPDMSAELAVLRKTAAALEPGGVRTKLLIPNDQIKFMTLETPGLSDAARMSEARRALEGATPYDVDDLAFDISSDGAQTHVAAVALETLAEAEAFATEHRFYPVSFVARPDSHVFKGEPFFGPTDVASSLLERDEAIEPDDDAVVVLGPYVPPVKEPQADEALSDLFQTAPAKDGPDAETPQDKTATPRGDDATSFVRGREDIIAAKPAIPPAPALPEDMAAAVATEPAKQAQPEVKSEPAQNDAPEDLKARVRKAISAAAAATGAAPAGVKAPPKAAAAAPVPAPTAFSSRRSSAAAPPVGTAKRADAAAKGSTPDAPVPDSRSLSAVPAEKPKAKIRKWGFLSKGKPRKTPPPPAAASYGAGVAVKDTSITLPKTTSEAERMTIFGARKSNNVGGKPRFLGLALTAALLVFLAGVAAWASVFLDDGLSLSRWFTSRDTTAIASAPVEPRDPAPNTVPARAETSVALPDTVTTPQPPTPQPAEERVAALDPSLTDEDSAVLDALRVPELAQPRTLTQQEIEAKYATSGIWVMAPETPIAPAMVPIDDLYMTSIDPVSSANDAVALPRLASFGGDTVEFSPASPAPPGTSFTLDDKGLVVPTPDGALNADGIKVIAGRPPAEPPKTLTRSSTQTPEAAPEVPETQPGLLEFRPVVRPGDLVESNERSTLGGLTRTELASLRPSLRPASVQQTAATSAVPQAVAPEVQAASAAAGASLAAIVTVAPKPAGPVLNNATPYAVQASVRPDTRPRNFARIVKRAERATPEPTQVASTAAVAPRTVAPSLPSKASVATQATVKNAIKLRDINLIGVYGKPSSRRALIRLSNGRYQKVAVGDRLDGGRVSAIGENELRYTRRGRDVVLKMPRS